MHEIIADVTGVVWKVHVTKGASVNAGETLVTVESMKMEIPVECPISGTVEAVHVSEGDQVNEGSPVAVIV